MAAHSAGLRLPPDRARDREPSRSGARRGGVMMHPLLLTVLFATAISGCKFFTFSFDHPDFTNVPGWHFYWMDVSQLRPVLGSDMPVDKMGGCGGTKTNAVDMECLSGAVVTTWMTTYDANGVESAASNGVEVRCP